MVLNVQEYNNNNNKLNALCTKQPEYFAKSENETIKNSQLANPEECSSAAELEICILPATNTINK